MALGTDVLLKSLVKAFGLDPESFVPQLMQFFEWAKNSIVGFDARLKRMEETSAILAQQNAEFIAIIKAANHALLNHVEQKETTQNEPN